MPLEGKLLKNVSRNWKIYISYVYAVHTAQCTVCAVYHQNPKYSEIGHLMALPTCETAKPLNGPKMISNYAYNPIKFD